MPRPPTAPAGFGFPSIAVTMTTWCFGFFAVLIARELPGRQTRLALPAGGRDHAGGFARLYLGAHWLSDVVGGTLFGIVWLLVLGIAYRRHVARSFWMRPLASAVLWRVRVAAALWHAPRAVEPLLARFTRAARPVVLALHGWWGRRMAPPAGPSRRARAPRRRWPLDLQVGGPAAACARALQAQGWRVQPQADWTAVLGLLDDDTPATRQPVLPADASTARPKPLLLVRPGARPDERFVLRLWRAPAGWATARRCGWAAPRRCSADAARSALFALWRPQAVTERDAEPAFAALAALRSAALPGARVLRCSRGARRAAVRRRLADAEALAVAAASRTVSR